MYVTFSFKQEITRWHESTTNVSNDTHTHTHTHTPTFLSYERNLQVVWQFPLKMLHPRNPPNQESQIPWYLVVQIQSGFLVWFESVTRNLSFWTWWISGGAVLSYGVATISRLLKIIGLFCKRALWKRRYSAKETYNIKEPTYRSHPIRSCAREVYDRIHWKCCIPEIHH